MGNSTSSAVLPRKLTVTYDDCGVIGGKGSIITFIGETGMDTCEYDIPTTHLSRRVFYRVDPADFSDTFYEEFKLHKTFAPDCVYCSTTTDTPPSPAVAFEESEAIDDDFVVVPPSPSPTPADGDEAEPRAPLLFLLRQLGGKKLFIVGPHDAQYGIRDIQFASRLGDEYGFTVNKWWHSQKRRPQLPGSSATWQLFMEGHNFMQQRKTITFACEPLIDCTHLGLLDGSKTGPIRIDFGVPAKEALVAVHTAALPYLRHGDQPEDICITVDSNGMDRENDSITAASVLFRPSFKIELRIAKGAQTLGSLLSVATEWGVLDPSQITSTHPWTATAQPTTIDYVKRKVATVLGCDATQVNLALQQQDGKPLRRLGRSSATLRDAGIVEGAVIVVSERQSLFSCFSGKGRAGARARAVAGGAGEMAKDWEIALAAHQSLTPIRYGSISGDDGDKSPQQGRSVTHV